MTCTTVMTKRDHALAWAERGFSVFPLQEDAKEPLPGSNGHLGATRDPQKIRELWTDPLTGSVLNYNVGASPRDGNHVIIDLDVKDGRDGVAAYRAIGGDIGGLVIRTPTRGLHIYYSTQEAIRTSAGKLAPGIDSRGPDGFVVAPGSTINGVAYEIIEDTGIRPLPAFVAATIGTRAERDSCRLVTTHAVKDDLPHNVERFEDYCRRAAPAVAGVWHDTSRDLACEAVRHAVSVENATEVLLRHWVPRGTGFYEEGRHERWPADVAESYRWALDQGEHGVDTLEAYQLAFQGIVPPPSSATCCNAPTAERATRIRGFTPDNCLGETPAPYLIKSLLARGQVGMVIGPPGAGKSCLVPLLAYKVAQGFPVFGMRTRQGAVLYLALEDESGMKGRIAAHHIRYGSAPDFQVFTGVSSLFNADDVAEIKRLVAEYDPALIVFDTLRSGFRGLKEVDADAMGEALKTIRDIIRRTDGQLGPAGIIVHHPTKADPRSASGSGALDADVDVSLYLEKDPASGIVAVTLGKNRNGASDGRQMAFKIEPVEIGTDEDGDAVTRPVAIEVELSALKKERGLSGQVKGALVILKILIEEGGPEVFVNPPDFPMAGVQLGGSSGTLVANWVMRCELCGLSKAGDPASRATAFRRAKADLLERKLIAISGEHVLLLKDTGE